MVAWHGMPGKRAKRDPSRPVRHSQDGDGGRVRYEERPRNVALAIGRRPWPPSESASKERYLLEVEAPKFQHFPAHATENRSQKCYTSLHARKRLLCAGRNGRRG